MTANRSPVRPAELVSLVMLLGLGGAIRVSHAMASGLWRDEALAVDIAMLPSVHDITNFLVHHESHPPLYYLLLRGWIMLAGASDAALVLPGIALGLGTIVLAWWFARRIVTPAVGLLAAALVALSYSVIESDSTVRPYGLLQLLLLGGVALLWISLTTGSRRALRGWVLCVVAAVYLHNWALLPVASMGIVALWLAVRGKSRVPTSLLIAAGGVVLVAWSPWIPELLYQLRHGGHLSPSSNPLTRLVAQFTFVMPGFHATRSLVAWAGVVPVCLLRMKAVVLPEETRTAFICLSGTVLLAMVFAGLGSFQTNLLIVHTVPMLAPLALTVFAGILMQPVNEGRLLARVATMLILLVSAFDAWAIATTPRSNSDLVARYVARRAQPEDLVLVVPVTVASSVLRYYHGSAPVAGYPDGIVDSPIEFNDRVARDTTAKVLAQVPTLVTRTFDRGGRVWQISFDAPEHLKKPWAIVEAEMTRRSGPPHGITVLDRKATLEHLDLRVWEVRTATTQPGR